MDENFVFDPETNYTVRFKKAVTAEGVRWRPFDSYGRPRSYEMRGALAHKLREHLASAE
ncbi:hypothetical protein L1787_16485 [Acuticoccus sp. M5D2P5]|uniref:hypothetical protein n=1 Tax=Acuticoccus kalidii TaxID=2910977 RepID=UPI001F202170|nr:hypothetical protein [Acuticoccus kalidii]MCF3935003.1 hypothetical protein [Acuticoccus kalidii]